ncbi:hypothetical protein CAEBREN_16484 [Caenorhabditis brenneri]|uniref:Sdz-33 F-box domain-containing protein n=1 Tax=Caenorhabditis brenneri TaxID=135651 RepID=G0MQ75_CAEBE|nr:hypothetical protein CAEBREN_16484 [Caenorhabditis brenneri]
MSKPHDQTTPTFPLLKLPFLPLTDAVKQMVFMDIYKLSLLSKKSETLLKYMQLKTDGFRVSFGSKCSTIRQIENERGRDTLIQRFYSNEEDMKSNRFRTFNQIAPDTMSLVPDQKDECVTLANGLSKLFKTKKFTYFTRSHPNKNPEEMKDFLSKMLSGSYTELSFSGIQHVDDERHFTVVAIDGGVLEYLMDTVKFDASLALRYSFPQNFSHDNAFKFRKVDYSDGSWVTMETLTSLQNAGSISLSGFIFDSKDLNEFIKYWINCEEDMIEDVTMNVKEQIIEEDVLKDLITVVSVSRGNQVHVMRARNIKNRRRILGKLTVMSDLFGITLETMEATDEYKVKLEILELKEKQNELEEELSKNEKVRSKTGRNGAIQAELAGIRKRLLALKI